MFTKTLATIGVGCGALGAGTVALAASDSPAPHRAPEVRLVPKTPDADARAAYGVLRRSGSEADRLPAGLRARARAAAQVQGPIDPRLVAEQGAIRLYARQTADGQVCLLYFDGTSGVSANTCVATQQAIDGDLPPEISMVGPDETTVYALVPDGVTTVTATAVDGTRREVPVRSNAVVVPDTPNALEWTTSDGRAHKLDRLATRPPR